MPAHSRSQNGVAELVVGPATSGRTRWLAHVAGIHVFGRSGSGHDDLEVQSNTLSH